MFAVPVAVANKPPSTRVHKLPIRERKYVPVSAPVKFPVVVLQYLSAFIFAYVLLRVIDGVFSVVTVANVDVKLLITADSQRNVLPTGMVTFDPVGFRDKSLGDLISDVAIAPVVPMLLVPNEIVAPADDGAMLSTLSVFVAAIATLPNGFRVTSPMPALLIVSTSNELPCLTVTCPCADDKTRSPGDVNPLLKVCSDRLTVFAPPFAPKFTDPFIACKESDEDPTIDNISFPAPM